jgi:hypothetical protein
VNSRFFNLNSCFAAGALLDLGLLRCGPPAPSAAELYSDDCVPPCRLDAPGANDAATLEQQLSNSTHAVVIQKQMLL